MNKINKKIISQLKELKTIEPPLLFIQNSRQTIFLSTPPQAKIWAWPTKLAWGLGLILVFLGLFYLGFVSFQKPSLSKNFDPKFLEREFESLTVNFQLQELSYHQQINQTIAAALSKINENDNQLNTQALKNEKEKIDQLLESNYPSSQIEELLNKIVL